MIPPSKLEQLTLDTSDKTFDVGSVSGIQKSMFFEEVILKKLEDLKVKNTAVRERLDRQDEVFKAQAGINTKIEWIFRAILSRLPPPS